MKKKIGVYLAVATSVVALMLFAGESWGHIPPDTVFTEGRMTGGGSIFTDEEDFFVPPGTRVTHGFQLQCDVTLKPNNLQVNIHLPKGDGGRFHLDELVAALCWDDETTDPHPPSAPFDHYWGSGTGRFNGEAGYCADWMFTDLGEPGTEDRIEWLRIWHCETEEFVFSVLREPGHPLTFGNHQAHKARGRK